MSDHQCNLRPCPFDPSAADPITFPVGWLDRIRAQGTSDQGCTCIRYESMPTTWDPMCPVHGDGPNQD